MSRAVATIVLLAGPSGSGKSRLAYRSGLPCVRLDDFYFDADAPGLPRMADGVIDWDDPAAWDAAAAGRALIELARTGRTVTPAYDIAESARTGTRMVDLGGAPAVVAEGIFAAELSGLGAQAEVPVVAIWLDRPRLVNWWRRLRRDIAQHRKPLGVLLRRGVMLCRAEPGLRATAVARGFVPLTMRAAVGRLVHVSVGLGA